MSGLKIDDAKIKEAIETISKYGGEAVVKCVQCGACSGICPGVRVGFNVLCRMLIKRILTGQLEETLEEVSTWGCQACNRCTEVCPQGVRPMEVVFAFRRYQASELALSTSAFGPQMSLYNVGHAVTISPEAVAENRKKAGLPETPPTALNNEQAQKEIQTLLDNSPMAELGIF
ncbi:MAG TPA: heterodisulfide reductase [Desulfonauticus sp.]|nr:MAG: Heterodisulfide reductase subunit C [Desulfonauticus sp. 38_4375]HCO12132.1 heterodisulfide reductase [Desulfonauticus sp.]